MVERWTRERAWEWYNPKPWLVGCNFIPSTAVNQLEMWQKETFDPETIKRELGWANDLGFNTIRVYLHDLVWMSNPKGFKKRIDMFLDIASQRGISPVLVFFDDCWNTCFTSGPQPPPKNRRNTIHPRRSYLHPSNNIQREWILTQS